LWYIKFLDGFNYWGEVRPLGASIGDYLSQTHANGGLGLGTTTTSALFLITILGLVVYLTLTRKDEIPPETVQADAA